VANFCEQDDELLLSVNTRAANNFSRSPAVCCWLCPNKHGCLHVNPRPIHRSTCRPTPSGAIRSHQEWDLFWTDRSRHILVSPSSPFLRRILYYFILLHHLILFYLLLICFSNFLSLSTDLFLLVAHSHLLSALFCWRKLHNEELHNLYSSPSIITRRMTTSRRMRWAGHVARMWWKRNAYRILVGKPEGKRPLGTRRRRFVMLKWILERCDGMDWSGSG
jgi:hypothetical protein